MNDQQWDCYNKQTIIDEYCDFLTRLYPSHKFEFTGGVDMPNLLITKPNKACSWGLTLKWSDSVLTIDYCKDWLLDVVDSIVSRLK